jgi:hypothetical protein
MIEQMQCAMVDENQGEDELGDELLRLMEMLENYEKESRHNKAWF